MMIGGNLADPFCGQLGQHRRVNWPACPPGQRPGNARATPQSLQRALQRALHGRCRLVFACNLQRLPARATGQQSGQAGNTRQGTFKRRLARSVARPPARVFRGKWALDLAAFFAAQNVGTAPRVFFASIDVSARSRDVRVPQEVAHEEDVAGLIGELRGSCVA